MAYTVGTEYFSNGYQPKTINGKTLKKTGMTIGDTKLKGSTSWDGKNMDDQNIWTDGTRQWIWVRTDEGTGYYVSYNYKHANGAVDFSNTSSDSYKKYIGLDSTVVKTDPNKSGTTKVVNNKQYGSVTPVYDPVTDTVVAEKNYKATTNTTTSSKPSSSPSSNSNTSADPGLYDLIQDLRNENADIKKQLEEALTPKYYTADELAEMHGVQDLYNEQKWLDDYNKATNKYYDEAVASQQDLRNAYAVNNGQYLDKTLDSYMESYANQAPTATAKGATAANALSTMLGAGQTYANDDYSMLQTENLLEEQRKAELANNPNLARQQYNNIGMLLSQLGTDYYSSAVKEYVNQLDAYGSMYAGNRAAESLANSGTAAKYNGLLNASVKNAANTAGGYNSNKDYYDLYNYGLAINNGNKTAADKFVVNALSTNRINNK